MYFINVHYKSIQWGNTKSIAFQCWMADPLHQLHRSWIVVDDRPLMLLLYKDRARAMQKRTFQVRFGWLRDTHHTP